MRESIVKRARSLHGFRDANGRVRIFHSFRECTKTTSSVARRGGEGVVEQGDI